MRRKLFIAIVFLLLIGVGIAYYLFSMKFDDMNDVKADYEISAVDLIKEFQTNDSVANKKYTEKILLVTGKVSEMESGDSSINIKMSDEQSGSYIIFSIQKNEEGLLKDIKSGDVVVVKGSCSGAIFSDILSAYSISFKRCILSNNKK